MRWRNRRQSTNIEDRRRRPMARKVAGGGLGTIVLVLVGLYFGIDPGVILQSTGTLAPPSQTSHVALSPEEKELGEFVAVVLADTEDTWHAIFQQAGSRIPGTETGALFRRGGIRLRLCPIGHRPVLLPGR